MADDGGAPVIGTRTITPIKGAAVDFIELWRGVPDDDERTSNWGGSFSGRTELADVLWPMMRMRFRGLAQKTLKIYLAHLRQFWRFLDAYEDWTQGVAVQFQDITYVMGTLWCHPPTPDAWAPPSSPVALWMPGSLLRDCHRQAGTEVTFLWPSISEEPSTPKEVADAVQAKAALNLLKRQAQAIYARWNRADRLAATGRNLLNCPRDGANRLGFTPVEADYHATYRAFIERVGDPLPKARELYAALGSNSRVNPLFWKANWADLQAGLYPTSQDLFCLSQLFMARSGWNASTVFALDIGNSNWAVPLPGALDLIRIESWKERSHTWQDTVCRARLTTGPFHIVCTLLQRTAPLRALLVSDAARLSSGVVQDALRSPWLAANASSKSDCVVALSAGLRFNAWWRTQVADHNRIAAEWNKRVNLDNRKRLRAQKGLVEGQALTSHKVEIPHNMTPGDWRDIYAGFVFVDSGYSWLLTQWALGHKHLSSTRHYLRSRLWRRFSENKLREAQSAILGQIETGDLDLALLRCKLDLGVEPSAEDRARLAAFRALVKREEITPSGYHCGTPMHPPPEMDPGNPSDGTMRARCGDRCSGCPFGTAVDFDYIAKALVAHRWKRCEMSAAAWEESQFPAQMDMLAHDLTQWPDDEVAARIAHWEAEFDCGRVSFISAGLI